MRRSYGKYDVTVKQPIHNRSAITAKNCSCSATETTTILWMDGPGRLNGESRPYYETSNEKFLVVTLVSVVWFFKFEGTLQDPASIERPCQKMKLLFWDFWIPWTPTVRKWVKKPPKKKEALMEKPYLLHEI